MDVVVVTINNFILKSFDFSINKILIFGFKYIQNN